MIKIWFEMIWFLVPQNTKESSSNSTLLSYSAELFFASQRWRHAKFRKTKQYELSRLYDFWLRCGVACQPNSRPSVMNVHVFFLHISNVRRSILVLYLSRRMKLGLIKGGFSLLLYFFMKVPVQDGDFILLYSSLSVFPSCPSHIPNAIWNHLTPRWCEVGNI